ncbi:hypothetical protein Pelo_8740 [Pelomyxa schiedti]|nr:hypothetical protein Pelo_8740 [Pelomyxa schiedti]
MGGLKPLKTTASTNGTTTTNTSASGTTLTTTSSSQQQPFAAPPGTIPPPSAADPGTSARNVDMPKSVVCASCGHLILLGVSIASPDVILIEGISFSIPVECPTCARVTRIEHVGVSDVRTARVAYDAPKVKVFEVTSRVEAHPKADLSVTDPGWKVIGGAAAVFFSASQPGSLLTKSAPLLSGNRVIGWSGAAKDHDYSCPLSITVYAFAIHDPDDVWDVMCWNSSSARTSRPSATVSVGPGYTLTGGGAEVHWEIGNLLTSCCPSGDGSWSASAKDHNHHDPSTLTVYAIGVAPKRGQPPLRIKIQQAEGMCDAANPGNNGWKAGRVVQSEGGVVIGGGAQVNYQGPGCMLYCLRPMQHGFEARAKDHGVADHTSAITVFCISLL